VCLLLKPTSTPEDCTAATTVDDCRQSGPSTPYKCTFNSFARRHSAEQVKKNRAAHCLCSRFADVLSLEYSGEQLSGRMKADHGLLGNVRSLILTSSGQSSTANTLVTAAGFQPVLPVTAVGGRMLSSSSLRQLSLAGVDGERLMLSGRQCKSFMNTDVSVSLLHRRTPGDLPSYVLLSPITTPCTQSQRHVSDQHRVS